MPRKKADRPTPPHVSPFSKAVRATKRRKAKQKLRVVAGTAAARALGIK